MSKSRHAVLFCIAMMLSGTAHGQHAVDAALMTAARAVMPEDVSVSDIRAALEAGLWHEDPPAVAVSLARGNEYMTFVFRRQAGGAYSAADASWVAKTAFGFWGFPRDEIERFETTPISWQMNEGGNLFVLIQTRGWREGQRYTARGYFLVSPDGTVSGQ